MEEHDGMDSVSVGSIGDSSLSYSTDTESESSSSSSSSSVETVSLLDHLVRGIHQLHKIFTKEFMG